MDAFEALAMIDRIDHAMAGIFHDASLSLGQEVIKDD
jgi:hypothetical protein